MCINDCQLYRNVVYLPNEYENNTLRLNFFFIDIILNNTFIYPAIKIIILGELKKKYKRISYIALSNTFRLK